MVDYLRQSYVVVVTQGNCSMIRLLIQDKIYSIDDFKSLPIKRNVEQPFSPSIMSFVSKFSKELLKGEYRNFPDLQALGYWFRNSRINKFEEIYAGKSVPMGTVFHICPSNVDTIFIYSLFISLLMGNMNIVRLSSKESEQINILISIFKKISLTDEYSNVLSRILLVSYERDDEITSFFSSISHLRVFWGGNESIKNLRKIPAPSYTRDIYFPDRESISVIDQLSFSELNNSQQKDTFKSFVNDIKIFNQQACSSPLRLFWIGDEPGFQNFININNDLEFDLDINTSEIMDKLVSISSMVAENDGLKLLNRDFSKIIFVNVQTPGNQLSFHVGNGLILVTFIKNLSEIIPFTNPKTQTLSHYGLTKSEINELLIQLCDSQIDRICKIGSALDFDHVWDGKDLFVHFSRLIRVDS